MFLPLVTPENLIQHYWPQPMLDNLFNFRFLSFFYCFCLREMKNIISVRMVDGKYPKPFWSVT